MRVGGSAVSPREELARDPEQGLLDAEAHGRGEPILSRVAKERKATVPGVASPSSAEAWKPRASMSCLGTLWTRLDYGTFQPIQIAAIVALNEAPDDPAAVCETYPALCDALCEGLARIDWPLERPRGRYSSGHPSGAYRDPGSLEFTLKLIREAKVAVSPGVGFGPGGTATFASRLSRTSSGSRRRSTAHAPR
jgi:hypothetical protein